MDYYVNAFKNYININGRARRTEYWMFVLFNFLFMVVLGFISELLHLPVLEVLYSLAILCPSFCLLVRRLHDIGKSGVWFLIVFIPLVGAVWLIVLMCLDSQPGENEYGPNPKGC